ncbi:sensor of ECF-type sigma factor [uncultured Aquimarina sp.]|uniref:sensor of ECF-type sigma factor n=1 Tax=uncultured Aquimarina sp. TaxID=575652 RepID=UPI00262BD256|nr:sensor of ECF-type sigma factor [uncultured Aquimarina sp.]
MKKILLLCVVIFIVNFSFGQRGPRGKVKALKIAYITEQLDLSTKEAQQFWPIYNEHEEAMENLKRNERKSIRAIKEANGLENISEQEAEDFLTNYVSTEEKKFLARKQLIKNLSNVIPNKKILKLVKAEMDFNKRLLKQLRDRRRANQ